MFTIDSTTQKVLKRYPHRAADIAQSFDQKQIESKLWLQSEFVKLFEQTDSSRLERINIVGGWYGHQLIPIIRNILGDITIVFYELDAEAMHICKNYYFAEDKNIKYRHQDATEATFSGNTKLTICTSCEHMKPLNVKRGIVVLQSNDYFEIADHVNCVKNLNDFKSQYDIKTLFYEGVLHFEKYKRFMIIGRI